MIFSVLSPEKFDINSLYICPPHLYTVATLPWDIQKSHFQQYTSDYLRYLSHMSNYFDRLLQYLLQYI